MTRTRRGAGGDDVGGRGSYGNNNEDLPPPPWPTLAKLMGMLAEGQHAMDEAMRTMA